METVTWRDLCGPVCIFLDDKWENGKLIKVHKDEVVYTLSGDLDQFIIIKDEAYGIIRPRQVVADLGRGDTYTGTNPLFFGPAGQGLYGKIIVERKDRPGNYRVHFKYRPQKSVKTKNVKLNLGKHKTMSEAEAVCDGKIREWLDNRKKYASQKRKRTTWIRRRTTPTKECNTPKRAFTHNSNRRGKSSGVLDEQNEKEIFSPVANSMVATPMAKHVRKKPQKKKKQPVDVRCVCCLFVCLFVCLIFLFAS